MLRLTRKFLFPKLSRNFKPSNLHLQKFYFSSNEDPKIPDEKENKVEEKEKKENDNNKGKEKEDHEKDGKKKKKSKNKFENMAWVKFGERIRNKYLQNKVFYQWIGALSLISLAIYFSDDKRDIYQTGNYADFINDFIPNRKVSKIQLRRNQKGTVQVYSAILTLEDGRKFILNVGNPDAFLENLESVQTELGFPLDALIPIEFKYSKDYKERFHMASFIFGKVLSIMIILIVWRSVRGLLSQMSKGNLFGIGKSEVKQYNMEKSVKVKFDDVAGLDEAKVEIKEFVDFLKNFTKFHNIGARIPKGALLVGPPGTGKTMLAKACAGEAGVPFYYASGSDFVEMYVGLGASRVRELFENAKSNAPAIIFIDEIDAIAAGMGGNDEKDNTLNQLLVEMDGFATNSNVVVLAATNISDSLDPALTRPGRFDRSIELTLPDIDGRNKILCVHLKPIKLHSERTLEEYARRLSTLTPGFSGADLANLCNEAAIHAARLGKHFVDHMDFEMAAERVMAGIEKKMLLSEDERKRVAIHESGHAVVSWFLEGGSPLIKLTIIPRSKGALGFAQYLPSENSLQSRNELIDSICCALGGRFAEKVLTGEISSGAADDLEKVYKYAEALVKKLGMSEKIGLIGFIDNNFRKVMSEHQQKDIDLEILKIIQECGKTTLCLVEQYRGLIENLSNELLKKETLDLNDIKGILGERPFTPKSNYKAYLETKEEDVRKENVIAIDIALNN